MEEKTIRTDIVLPGTEDSLKIYTELGRDGKADWHVRLPLNAFSYEELFKAIKDKGT